MKKWGWYFPKDGLPERISAKEVLYRDETEGGWRGKAYYPYKNGSGGVMHAKRSSTGTPFFAFNCKHDAEEWERKGGGESQTHYLFKMALLELESTVLKFKGGTLPDTKITFKSANDEKAIGPYFIDVYCLFESDNLLGIKWEGKLGIELCLTNPVLPEKKEFLIQNNIPVVQHHISERMIYMGPEDEEDPEAERAYIEFVKSKIKENFMLVSLISDPSSELYELMTAKDRLLKENKELMAKNARLFEENKDLTIKNASLLEENRGLTIKSKSQSQDINLLKQAISAASQKVADISQQLSSKKDKLELANKRLNGAFTNIDELEKAIESYKFNEWVYVVVFSLSIGITAFGYMKGIILLNI
ncbi:hypothetical protein CWB89_06400 [Pseudoalteromonas piscicida]|uniref:Uncharacterized protein n=1 Tax=Pseudoalteromonas piscicida TaxID=43662 RepID=A0AAQ2EUB0_PSEO7|nr:MULTISPECIES: hypothetical protein [Pseudoalteromonas]KJY90352.1 hypothetical protein TW75_06865 [Pseudoalteromonas piscicida]TMN43597.1 hypothetical protein CWB95_05025 [Pseudoalteromonas piscicida]TMN44046.1 hypothetical protein CWB94_01475 [Pseudoalteromonas piscicida]TMN56837.1 hypothetical protein CWB92_01730 [Pseudoalteromonas piscicida]TMN57418.1 hypothetical protein CWB91_03435 [Pseudoalteromonas piscicida]